MSILKDGLLDMQDLKSKLSEKTKFVSITHASNILGVVNPIQISISSWGWSDHHGRR